MMPKQVNHLRLPLGAPDNRAPLACRSWHDSTVEMAPQGDRRAVIG
jgi:hypothetical protein